MEHGTIYNPGIFELVKVYRIPGMILISATGGFNINAQIFNTDFCQKAIPSIFINIGLG